MIFLLREQRYVEQFGICSSPYFRKLDFHRRGRVHLSRSLVVLTAHQRMKHSLKLKEITSTALAKHYFYIL